MATHQISILGAASPDNTGRCWWEPYDVLATNDVWKHMVLRFANPTSNGQTHGIYGVFNVPMIYVQNAEVVAKWTAAVTSGTVQWRMTYRAVGGDDAESLDQTSNQQQIRNSDVAPSAVNERMLCTITLTEANFVAGDTVEFLFERADSGGDDTLAADVILHDLVFQFDDV